jgi:hypothetical protein
MDTLYSGNVSLGVTAYSLGRILETFSFLEGSFLKCGWFSRMSEESNAGTHWFSSFFY